MSLKFSIPVLQGPLQSGRTLVLVILTAPRWIHGANTSWERASFTVLHSWRWHPRFSLPVNEYVNIDEEWLLIRRLEASWTKSASEQCWSESRRIWGNTMKYASSKFGSDQITLTEAASQFPETLVQIPCHCHDDKSNRLVIIIKVRSLPWPPHFRVREE